MSTLYDILFGNQATSDGDESTDGKPDPRVDGSLWQLLQDSIKAGNFGNGWEQSAPKSDNSLWQLVLDSKAPAWSGDIGGFIPPGVKLGLPGYYGEAAGNLAAPDSSAGGAGLGQDWQAPMDAGAGRPEVRVETDGEARKTDPWNMKPSSQLIDFIANYETFKPLPYRPTPSDKPTIGYGHQIQPGEDFNDGINEETAKGLLQQQIGDHAAAVNDWARRNNVKLTQQQFDALVSLDYNLAGGVEYGAATLTGRIKSGEATPEDIREAFSLYNKGPDGPEQGLVNRRADEADMFLNGDYSRKYR
ncbi:MAG: lysozyme [Negativicutes bacterium]|nr:lysozyme [Negativicutes bacterium]